MKSKKVEESTSRTKVTNISNHGIWLCVKGTECFLPCSKDIKEK
ncbi:MAG: hypothetical protein JETT_3550 [Candidatus Jettenia ecosi]|uniref:Uncharacterized protein n=1 Tax=Candidatus Jettenia ecosi TaxID=2494326 RepID=A0A533Q6H2_9BACT|nr:MAG: hypothetical protein JETT_3550 [Candidatus Jettenia ecosi]